MTVSRDTTHHGDCHWVTSQLTDRLNTGSGCQLSIELLEVQFLVSTIMIHCRLVVGETTRVRMSSILHK
jgi:hypothetical protein